MSFDIEFEKFANHILKKWFVSNDKKRRIIGKFKEKDNKIVITEEFDAYEIRGENAFGTYKCYIKYFNHTLRPREKERIPISAEWVI